MLPGSALAGARKNRAPSPTAAGLTAGLSELRQIPAPPNPEARAGAAQPLRARVLRYIAASALDDAAYKRTRA